MDITTLLIITIVIGIANIGFLIWMKSSAKLDPDSSIKDSMLKFGISLNKNQETTFSFTKLQKLQTLYSPPVPLRKKMALSQIAKEEFRESEK